VDSLDTETLVYDAKAIAARASAHKYACMADESNL